MQSSIINAVNASTSIEECERLWKAADTEEENNKPTFKLQSNHRYKVSFSGWWIGHMELLDQDTNTKKNKKTLVLYIDNIDGKDYSHIRHDNGMVGKKWITTSEKLQDQVKQYVLSKRLFTNYYTLYRREGKFANTIITELEDKNATVMTKRQQLSASNTADLFSTY
jgi:hypothetical protein